MRRIPKDYKPPENDFETFEDGEYKVIGLQWYSVDDKERPILVAQKDGRLVGRAYMIIEDDVSGPPYSCELGQMGLLVQAFGGDVDKLPPVPEVSQAGKVTAYMEKVQELAVGKTIEVTVSKGWVNSVEGIQVPPGLYYYELEGFNPTNEDGEPILKAGEYGQFFFVLSRILAGEGGAETPWKGAVVRDLVNYSITVDTSMGEPIPEWQRTKQGAFTKSAALLAHFMQYTAPGMFEEGYVHSDPYNLLPDWWEEAQKEKVVYKGYRAKTKDGKYVNMNWSTVEPVPNFAGPRESSRTQETNKRQQQVEEKGREGLIAFMNLLAGGDAFSNVGTLALNQAGKTAAKTYLTPLKQKGILSTGTLTNLSFDDVMRVVENVEVGEELVEGVTKIKHSLAAAGVGFEEEGNGDF